MRVGYTTYTLINKNYVHNRCILMTSFLFVIFYSYKAKLHFLHLRNYLKSLMYYSAFKFVL